MNNIELRSIDRLVTRPKEGDVPARTEHYIIPDYQRGYRWRGVEHVKALLEDIEEFRKTSQNRSDIYCLQPVVVAQRGDDWEIIDGQQRLTTISLILHYLNQPNFSISYDYRPESTEVLKNPEVYNDALPDHYYICQAYSFIQTWFEEMGQKEPGYLRKFSNCFCENVQVIWYEVELNGTTEAAREEEKIQIFNRLNIGKIPLDDAELIRALFIKHFPQGAEHTKVVEQTIFAQEWEQMEVFLRQDEVWGFIHKRSEKSNKTDDYPNRILRLFELAAQQTDQEGRATFRYYENVLKGGRTAREEWKRIKTIFAYIRHWFADYQHFHFIGLLIAGGMPLGEILKQMELATSKPDFLKWLRMQVKQKLYVDDWEDLQYGDGERLTNFLLLFNVLSCIQTEGRENLRFRFDLYNKTSWSIEHINAQRSENPLKEPKFMKLWIEETTASLKKILEASYDERVEKSVKELDAILQSEKIEVEHFNRTRDKIIRLFFDKEDALNSSEDLDILSNLALLSREHNSALNNHIFPVKRELLINILQGKNTDAKMQKSFVPICTQRVFLKAYTKGYTEAYRWSDHDREDYLNEIRQVINNFIQA